MKDKLAILFIGILAVLSVIAFAACDKMLGHTHDFGEWEIATTATCMETAIETGTCDCGEVTTRTTGTALGHDYILSQSGLAATCTATGYTAHNKCSRCDEISGKASVPALGHDYGDYYGNTATCIAGGTEYRDCTRIGCGHADSRNTSALGHDYGDYYGNTATCIAGGTEYRDCQRNCGHTDSRPTAELNHYFSVPVSGLTATCTTAGYTAHYKCSRCDEVLNRTIIPIDTSNHDFSVPVSGLAATCTMAGYTAHYKCSRCDEVWDKTTVSVLWHDYSGYYGNTATCTAGGTERRDCRRNGCGYTDICPTYALGHDFSVYVRGLDATCTTAGYTAHLKCGRCDEISGKTTIPIDTSNHDLRLPVNALAPTCTAEGYTEHYQCVLCGEASGKTAVPIDPSNHYWYWTLTQATETTDGLRISNCVHCDKSESEVRTHATGTKGLIFSEIKGGTEYSIIDYKLSNVNLFIPAYHNGLPVTEIRYNAFSDCSDIESVTFASGSMLEVIDNTSFRRCTKISSITIPASVKSIGYGVFLGCTSLENIAFSENSLLEVIDAYAFSDCIRLANITIPSSVMSIGYCAFRNCTSLAEITIPASVTTIGYYVFENWTDTQTIYIAGFSSQAEAVAVWGVIWIWGENSEAQIVYQG